MNEAKVTDLDYITFLLAAPRVVSCTEGARVQPEGPRRAAHDALNRLLNRLEPDPLPLWREAEALVERTSGLLIIDDTTLDKPYARRIALVHRHWSSKHRRVVAGINLATLVWGAGGRASPASVRRVADGADAHGRTSPGRRLHGRLAGGQAAERPPVPGPKRRHAA